MAELKLPSESPEDKICPVRHTLQAVGGKWKLRILCLLYGSSPKRHGQIKNLLPGITGMVLSQSLKELENVGLIVREQYSTIPPKVEYSLSQEGRELFPALHTLADWGRANLEKESCGNSCQCNIADLNAKTLEVQNART